MRAKAIMGCLFCTLLAALALGAGTAQADRALLTETAVETTFCIRCPPRVHPETLNLVPPPDGQIEGPCGFAVAPEGGIYVSDYYHHVVHDYSGGYQSSLAVGDPPEGPCGLAFDPVAGALYVNLWHESVVRLKPTFQVFDTANSTGVAVDAAGNVYVDDRTYVAVYEPSGAPVLDEGEPLRIGLGSLGEGFGLAVFAGKVYVPDAADNTVKVYEPAVDPLQPSDTISPPEGFNSLVDSSVAVDPTNGNLLVVDNLKPGYEHPAAGVLEFDSAGNFLGQLPSCPQPPKDCVQGRGPVHGEPSGIAVDPASGFLFVTDGNGEESNVFGYSPYTAGEELGAGAPPPGDEGSLGGAAAGPGAGAMAVSAATGAQPGSSSNPDRSAKRSRKRIRRGRGRVAVWGAVALHGWARR